MRFPERLETTLASLLGDRAEEPGTALVPSLKAMQRELGWVDDDALGEITARLGVDRADAENLAAYFEIRRAAPPARHVIEVCVNVHCRRRGGDAVLARLQERLGISAGGATADGAFALREIVCFKACDFGPNVFADQEHREAMTPESADALIDELLARDAAR
jgi:NADH:ubiquinone oxidoreductase subunit E